jgi:hypothetical protein
MLQVSLACAPVLLLAPVKDALPSIWFDPVALALLALVAHALLSSAPLASV